VKKNLRNNQNRPRNLAQNTQQNTQQTSVVKQENVHVEEKQENNIEDKSSKTQETKGNLMEQLNEKVTVLLENYHTMKEQTEVLRSSVVQEKAQNEAKDLELTRVTEELAQKDQIVTKLQEENRAILTELNAKNDEVKAIIAKIESIFN
jgi:hypothetical protein